MPPRPGPRHHQPYGWVRLPPSLSSRRRSAAFSSIGVTFDSARATVELARPSATRSHRRSAGVCPSPPHASETGSCSLRERQRPYLSLLGGRQPVLDAGCGRGEFLDLLRDAGVPARGVDLDPGMVARTRGRAWTSSRAISSRISSALPTARWACCSPRRWSSTGVLGAARVSSPRLAEAATRRGVDRRDRQSARSGDTEKLLDRPDPSAPALPGGAADLVSGRAQIPRAEAGVSADDYAGGADPQAPAVAPPSAQPGPDPRRAARARGTARRGGRAARRPWRGRVCARGW